MKRSNRLILLIGVFLAIVTFVGIVLILGSPRDPGVGSTNPTSLPTVFSTREIPLGTVVTEQMLRVDQEWPVTQRDTSAFADPSLVVGKIVRTNVPEGRQLTASDFAVSGAPTTLDCPAGQRCIAVDVNQVTGAGTLIRTGDYVDMLVSFNMQVITLDPDTGAVQQGAPEITQTSTKLLLQGMQVVGTLLPPPPAAAEGGGAAAEGDAGTALNDQREIVLVSANAQQAEVIKHAQTQTGSSISLVLRSPSDFYDPTTREPIVPVPDDTTGVTLSLLVNEYDVLVPQVIEAILPGQDGGPEEETP